MSNDEGSISVLLAGTVFAVLVLGMVIGAVGQVLAARFQASTAADAAALAAAPATFFGHPGEAAGRLAAANGARLLSCRCPPNRTWAARTVQTLVEVDVDVLGLGPRTVRAKGSAEYVPVGNSRAAPAPSSSVFVASRFVRPALLPVVGSAGAGLRTLGSRGPLRELFVLGLKLTDPGSERFGLVRRGR